jgi:hypothetical protein
MGTAGETVAPRPITVTAVSSTKVYDGTTSSTAVPTITGGSLVSGDMAAFTEVYLTKNVGAGQTLTVEGSVNDGYLGNNYQVSVVTAAGQITPRPITVTAAPWTKAYDGATSSTAVPTINSCGLASGDTAAFIETFDTPALGTGKTLTPTGSVSDGNGGINYSVTFVSGASGAIISSSRTTSLAWTGPGNPLYLTESTPGATATVLISEPSFDANLLKIDLGEGNFFAGTSTAAATGLTYQSGSPTTSEWATIDISSAGNISSLVTALSGDPLVIGPIRDLDAGIGSIAATAGSIEVTGIDTFNANGIVSLTASGNLTVDPGASVLTGTGTISLAADVNANGAGNDGLGTLSIGAGAVVDSTSTSSSAITLRGAGINVDTSSNPALVGAQRLPSTTPTATLRGLDDPHDMAFDASGSLYVANFYADTVSVFAPGATTPAATLGGLDGPVALAFDASGNLYVANNGSDGCGTTVSKFAPGATTPTATLSGVDDPVALACDQSGNLYVANSAYSPLTGSTVSEFAPGATTPTATLTGLWYPDALAVDRSGNLYVANDLDSTNTNPGTTVSEFAPGATTPTATLTGLFWPTALSFDRSGNLYVANGNTARGIGTTVSEFAPGATTPTATLTGLSEPFALAFDSSGNLYAMNAWIDDTVSQFALNVTPMAGGVVVRSSVPSRPMDVGGTTNAVAGINLTDAELAQIYTVASGTVTVGDSSQTGNITITTATPATTPGAATVVLQSPTGPGGIILDDAGGTGTALCGDGGTISLSAGAGGIVAASANNSAAEIATTGATVTINTTGPVGTAANRIQFADNANTAEQVVQIGLTSQPGSVFLDGLGSLTLGNIEGGTANAQIDVTTRTNLVVATGATVDSRVSTLSLGADLNPDGTGNDGLGTLSIGSEATVISADPAANAVTLRGAGIDIDTSVVPATVGATCSLKTAPISALTGMTYPISALAFDSHGNLFVGDVFHVNEFAPGATTPTASLDIGQNGGVALAFDQSGDLYVIEDNTSNHVYEFSNGATTPTATLTGLDDPDDLAFDPSGNLYVLNQGNDTVSEFAPRSTTPTATLSGLIDPGGMAFDSHGDLYVTNDDYPHGTVSEFAPGATTPTATLIGLIAPYALAFDPHGNLYVGDYYNVKKFLPGATTPCATLGGVTFPESVFFDSSGNLYVTTDTNIIYEFAPGATTPTATLRGPGCLGPMAFDSNGNLWVANDSGYPYSVNEFTRTEPGNPTPGGVVIRSSLPTLPINVGSATGGTAGINLTDAELAQIYTTSSGTITFGDSSQTGDITFTTVTAATTPGASTLAVESPSGPGQIILDDAGSATGLNGNGGTVTLTPGAGGIVVPLSAASVPLATDGFNATGLTLGLSLTFAPALGTPLTLISNTAAPPAANPISGTFANLPQGGIISAVYGGKTYCFQANYAGGDGNDLVLTAIATPTTTALNTSQASATYGTPITFTAAVTAQEGTAAPTGSAEFFDGTTNRDLLTLRKEMQHLKVFPDCQVP